MNSTISRSGGAKLDTCSALVATRAKKFPPGEKKTLYLCLGVIILGSKSREIAPKSMRPGGAQLAHDPQRSSTSVLSVGMLRRVRLRAIRSGFPTKIFE